MAEDKTKLTDAQKAELKKAWGTDKEEFLGHVAHGVYGEQRGGFADFDDRLSEGIAIGVIVGTYKAGGKTFEQFIEAFERELPRIIDES